MTLADLWAECKALPHTIGLPLQDPTWFRRHMVNHLVGGPLLYGVGVWFGLPAFWFAVVATVLRQEAMREAKGPREFPLYAMLWDSATSSAAAGVVALVLRGMI
jgi:hypothetical protein